MCEMVKGIHYVHHTSSSSQHNRRDSFLLKQFQCLPVELMQDDEGNTCACCKFLVTHCKLHGKLLLQHLLLLLGFTRKIVRGQYCSSIVYWTIFLFNFFCEILFDSSPALGQDLMRVIWTRTMSSYDDVVFFDLIERWREREIEKRDSWMKYPDSMSINKWNLTDDCNFPE